MKTNRTQAALEMAANGRAYAAAIERVELAERIPPIRRRRIAELAAMVRLRPAVPIRLRRVRRDKLTTAAIAF